MYASRGFKVAPKGASRIGADMKNAVTEFYREVMLEGSGSEELHSRLTAGPKGNFLSWRRRENGQADNTIGPESFGISWCNPDVFGLKLDEGSLGRTKGKG